MKNITINDKQVSISDTAHGIVQEMISSDKTPDRNQFIRSLKVVDHEFDQAWNELSTLGVIVPGERDEWILKEGVSAG